MTDGIIQQVISKYILKYVMGYYNVNLYNKMSIEEMKELQQELIEEMKEEAFLVDTLTYGKDTPMISLKRLIGDNKPSLNDTINHMKGDNQE